MKADKLIFFFVYTFDKMRFVWSFLKDTLHSDRDNLISCNLFDWSLMFFFFGLCKSLIITKRVLLYTFPANGSCCD